MPGENVDYTPFAADPAFDAADGYSEEDQDLTFAEEATKKNLVSAFRTSLPAAAGAGQGWQTVGPSPDVGR